MRRLRSPSGAAVLRPQVVRTRVLRSKTLLWRDSFPPKDGKSGPHETGFMGQAKFPSKRGSGPWREVFGKHRPFYGQFADDRGKP